MNELILNPYDTVYRKVLEEGVEFREKARGYGLGSGNSIPGYASVEGFTAMVDAVKEIRRKSLPIRQTGFHFKVVVTPVPPILIYL
jgi:hypothetical protein